MDLLDCGPSGFCSWSCLGIFRVVYHNIHGKYNWISPTLIWTQPTGCLFTRVAVFTFVVCHARIIMIRMNGSTVSLMNSLCFAEMTHPKQEHKRNHGGRSWRLCGRWSCNFSFREITLDAHFNLKSRQSMWAPSFVFKTGIKRQNGRGT